MAKGKSKFRMIVEAVILVSFIVIGGIVIWQGTTFSPALSSSPTGDDTLTEARYWAKMDSQTVQCQLCFRNCIVPEGKRGYCGVRENREGTLYTLVYARPCSVTDGSPIEKLPLKHVLPGSMRLNIATAGCNFKCSFCHNWHIATRLPEEVTSFYLPPEKVIERAMKNKLRFIAFTYTEPTVFYEYMYDVSKLAKEKGLRTLLNTNGAMNPEPLRELLKYIDAVNVDLKAFTAEFYQGTAFAEMEPVLTTLKIIREEGVWLEIVNLIIPTLNDDMENIREMCIWIRDNLGKDVPLHFNRFFPAYKLTKLPPTPVETLERARAIALEVGLEYVTIGNVPGHEANSTFCPQCSKILIKRVHFSILANHVKDGKCGFCGHHIPGIWR